MKYMLLYDFFHILKEKYRYIITYFIVILILIFYQYMLKMTLSNVFYGVLGLEIYNNNLLFVLNFILTKTVFLFVTFQIFTHDFKTGLDNLFLRIDSKKWVLFKICSHLVITFFFKLFLYFLVGITLFILYGSLSKIPIIVVFLYDFIYTLSLQLLFVFIYYLYQVKPFIGLFSLATVVSFWQIIFPKFSFIKKYLLVYIVLFLITNILLRKIYQKNYVVLFERNSD